MKSILDETGYIFLKEFKPEKTIREICSELGQIQEIPNFPIIQTLKPTVQRESKINTYSGNYGFGIFPLHTDFAHWYLPPRYLMLRCIVPSKDVYTYILQVNELIKDLDRLTILRAMFIPRKRIQGRISLLRFNQRDKNYNLFRWDELFLNPANSEGKEVAEAFRSLDRKECEEICMKDIADTLIIDNWSMAHGRSKVKLADAERLIERVYLEGLN